MYYDGHQVCYTILSNCDVHPETDNVPLPSTKLPTNSELFQERIVME